MSPDLIRANVFTSTSDSIALYSLRILGRECSCVACANTLHLYAVLTSIIELNLPSIPEQWSHQELYSYLTVEEAGTQIT